MTGPDRRLRLRARRAIAFLMTALIVSACASAPTTSSAEATQVAASNAPSTRPTDPPPSESNVVAPGEAWVAFQSLADQFDPGADRDGVDHDDSIFLVRTDGTALHRLPPTDWVGSEIRPSWSMDGSRIAFIRGHLAVEGGELWTINADGTNPERLFACEAPCNSIGQPQWAPDGSAVYFNLDADAPADGGPPRRFALWRYSLATSRAEPVLSRTDGLTAEWIRLSPDGTHVVFVRARLTGPDGVAAVFVADLHSGKERRLTGWDLHPAYPDWSTTGRIVFNSHDLRAEPDTTEASNLFTMSVDGSNLRQITAFGPNDTRATQPRWTADGNGIVFTLVARVASDPFGLRQLAFINADGTGQRWLTPEPIVGTHPELRFITPAGV
jgi:Tol biopolymer transport system component